VSEVTGAIGWKAGITANAARAEEVAAVTVIAVANGGVIRIDESGRRSVATTSARKLKATAARDVVAKVVVATPIATATGGTRIARTATGMAIASKAAGQKQLGWQAANPTPEMT
jgi:hypothetical protein